MRSLSAPWRKALLTLHVASSVGWAGAVAGFAAVAALGWAGADAASAPGITVALRLMIWAVIVPAALLALVSGTLQSLVTPWGLVRHWWVVAKLVLTVPATAILLLHTRVADALAAAPSSEAAGGMRQQLLVDAAGGLAVLLLVTALSVVKPAGLTGYGRPRAVGVR